ncbi:hypothetical protein MUSASHINO07_04240 [Gemella sp. Musashino-2025]
MLLYENFSTSRILKVNDMMKFRFFKIINILTKSSKKLNSELRESNKCFTIIEREVLS